VQLFSRPGGAAFSSRVRVAAERVDTGSQWVQTPRHGDPIKRVRTGEGVGAGDEHAAVQRPGLEDVLVICGTGRRSGQLTVTPGVVSAAVAVSQLRCRGGRTRCQPLVNGGHGVSITEWILGRSGCRPLGTATQ
jgi:hypothetical protein